MSRIKSWVKNPKTIRLVSLFLAGSILYVILQNPGPFDPFARIINFMGTFIHEGGHSMATIATGGSVSELVVLPDGSGYAMTGGGNLAVILLAGYMTETFLSAIMFLINNRSSFGEVIPFLLGILFLGLTFRYGAKLAGGILTLVIGYGYGVFLIILAFHRDIPIPKTNVKIPIPDWLWMTVVNLMALYYGLGGILSLKYIADNAAPGNPDDISQFTLHYIPWIHPSIVAWFFCIVSIAFWLFCIALSMQGFLVSKRKPVALKG